MIAFLCGLVIQVDLGSCVIDVNGVGYLVAASTRTLAALPNPPEKARLLIETVVREDAILLYGFMESAEREWFRLLTSVQGVGAKVALGILSTLSPGELVAALMTSDKASLTRAPGVGGRLAERILTELRDKAGKMPGGGSGGITIPAMATPAGSIEADALMALAGLGFRRAEAAPVVRKVMDTHGAVATLDMVIRDSLKDLAR
ncbi:MULTISPECIES: Holliday junction branch migration protein RuvA [Acetobacter]|uniref:Holliday junction branch migration complex subunit RuvA n=1 Tax=Acetobacter pomorum DM001 TaxID=945681 RepID=F1YRS6_9PROT|nr:MULTISPECIES: Holliday junction branch migration protein RuvA [Acetobacter]ATI12340.1 Holliday junction branch migration protein RuvA [Acetobacter pomorum]AXC27521.1 Holliday junction branch migration protein RuvA [Acetobacter sp. JWB]EGE48516.1 Holliday junction ATP-dependent DNA helicase RuvA [Acetobacter pomorum DM001]KAA8423914.1 Holliday junction branch migration protein RuvA [Acetobacter pomorum]KAA8438383.1 Holliday junction branch migration protein RuvA [Acetobacter pomorum]